MTRLPDDAEPYRTVGPFTANTVPAALTKSHATKEGVWGRIEVSSGKLVLTRFDASGAAVARETVAGGETALVAPQEPHHVTLDADAAFSVTFLRRPKAEKSAAANA